MVGFYFTKYTHWARYLCILTAGFLENALGEIYSTYIREAASEPVANYAVSVLTKIQNPKSSKFIEVATCFKSEWGDQLQNYLNEAGRKEALDSIMNVRNQIAHGKSSNITIASLKDYFKKSIQVLDFIEAQCNPKKI